MKKDIFRVFDYLFSSIPLITCFPCGSNSSSGTRSSNNSSINKNNNSSNSSKIITYDKMISVVRFEKKTELNLIHKLALF